MSDPAQKIRVEPAGDWELWVASGKIILQNLSEFDWKLPLRLKPHRVVGASERLYYMHGEDHLYSPAQYSALEPILDAWDYSPGDTRGWWFQEERLKGFATKAPGITRDYYVVWPGVDPPREVFGTEDIVPPAEPQFSGHEIKFLKRIFQITGEPSYDALKILWLKIRQEAISWLVLERRPLDLGFVRIVPVPYRQNWKAMLAAQFRSVLHAFGKSGEERQRTLEQSGFFGSLSSVKLLAIDKDRFFARWTYEILPSKALETASEQNEFLKIQSIGKSAYASWILNQMSKKFGDTISLMSAYAAKILVPLGELTEGKRFGSVQLRPALKIDSVRCDPGLLIRVDGAPSATFERLSDVARENPPLPAPLPRLALPESIDSVSSIAELLDPRPKIMALVRKEENGCWIWTGFVHKGTRRGMIRWEGGCDYVHRIMWEAEHGEKLNAKVAVDQNCGNRLCVNPEHLFTRRKWDNPKAAQNRHRFAEWSKARAKEKNAA